MVAFESISHPRTYNRRFVGASIEEAMTARSNLESLCSGNSYAIGTVLNRKSTR